MTPITQSLRDEHRELLPNVEFLCSVADMVGEVPLETLRHEVARACAFLSGPFVKHSDAEDWALYPTVARLMGAPEATITMKRDHVEFAKYTQELELLRGRMNSLSLDQTQARALRRVLYSLYALIKLHFCKEEEIYFALLDKSLTPQDAHLMFKALGQAEEGFPPTSA